MPRLSERERERRSEAQRDIKAALAAIEAAEVRFQMAIKDAVLRTGMPWTELARASGLNRETLARQYGHLRQPAQRIG